MPEIVTWILAAVLASCGIAAVLLLVGYCLRVVAKVMERNL